MRRTVFACFMALTTAPVFLAPRVGHAADESCWPPLNGTAQIIEQPTRMGDYVFGSGSYSYFVGHYSVPSLHCEKSINSGPREWYLMVESGRVVVKGEPEGTRHGPLPPPLATSSIATLPALPPIGATLPTLPNMRKMPALNDLPPVEPLKPLN